MSQGVAGCQLTQLATLLEATATKLQLDTTAADIGLVAQVLVQGSDVTLDIAKLIKRLGDNFELGRHHSMHYFWLQTGRGAAERSCNSIPGSRRV